MNHLQIKRNQQNLSGWQLCHVIQINRRAAERIRLHRQSSDTETKRNLKKTFSARRGCQLEKILLYVKRNLEIYISNFCCVEGPRAWEMEESPMLCSRGAPTGCCRGSLKEPL